uniref:Secreted protein n=1 Tax=Candidatus Kentrum eta TaxID=2126337 RepID=A0A450V0H3_9GAMM|nr:MAG: hypothetical protein BECKH772A_GA0070896_100226 [Candidatus Kentron sp. H]VFJ91677.1 MAG: hypothetical protein BECKH772B_GA0070898_100206 [Candidatus Kentron sp. H]VFJ98281.1 MAG: hypothetical protein BECKH772C_GA0070978_100206 [Candidatus Kentron sp. H]
MKKTLIVILLMLLSATSYSVSPDPLSPRVAESRDACSDNKVRQQCQETCAMVCAEDKDFRDKNWGYCISILPPNSPRDDATCPSMVANAVQNVTPEDQCAHVTGLFPKIKCQQEVADDIASQFPKCTPNVPTLIDDAGKLTESIKATLQKFDKILALDLNVQTGEVLCGYSRDDLSRYYEQATQEGQVFVSLQSKAKQIEGCAGEIEEWLKKASTSTIDQTTDILHDNLIRTTSAHLEKLDPLRVTLIQSVEKLKAAGPQILALGTLHVRFCKSK